MNVILLEKVPNLGDLGDIVSVKSGYARNYLIPQGKAQYASEENIKAFEAKKAELEKKAADALAEANALLEKINGIAVTVKAVTGEEGKLFGSVGTHDIAEALNAQGFAIEKRQVRLPEGPFRQTGTYEVAIQLHSDVVASINLVVESENEE